MKIKSLAKCALFVIGLAFLITLCFLGNANTSFVGYNEVFFSETGEANDARLTEQTEPDTSESGGEASSSSGAESSETSSDESSTTDDSTMEERLQELGNKIGDQASSWWDDMCDWFAARWEDIKNWFESLPNWVYYVAGGFVALIILCILWFIFKPKEKK